MRYFLVAGEASGDLHAANLIKAILSQDSSAEFVFMGGEKMAAAAGCAPVVHYREIAFMGIAAVLKHYRGIDKAGKRMQAALLRFTPDHIVPVDSSGFNFRYLLPFAKRYLPSACISYYIVPKVWAWRSGRIKTLKRYCDKLLVIFPFEKEYFSRHGVDAIFVGNPCVNAVGKFLRSHGTETARAHLLQLLPTLDSQKPILALLAGSREQELRDNLPLMLRCAANHFPEYTPIIAGAPGRTPEDYTPYLQLEEGRRVQLFFDVTYPLLAAADMAVVTSGTATLETALIGTPQVVCYRMGGSRLANFTFRHLLPIPYFSPVNLIVGREMVEELLAADATEEKLAAALHRLKANLSEIREGYDELANLLEKKIVSEEAAKAIIC